MLGRSQFRSELAVVAKGKFTASDRKALLAGMDGPANARAVLPRSTSAYLLMEDEHHDEAY